MISRGSTRIAESLRDINGFLREVIESSVFDIESVPLSSQEAWVMHEGSLSHISGGFFHVVGIRNTITGEEQLALYQPQSALTGLALVKKNNTAYILLQARIEPGNVGIGQYGPTIQSTPANYLRKHGGKQTSYLDLFNTYHGHVRPITNSMQTDLGKRYYHKSKTHSYVELKDFLPTDENMIWVPIHIIAEMSCLDNFLNADLRSLINIFDWDRFLHPDLVPENHNTQIPSDLSLPACSSAGQSLEFIPLNDLKRWKLTDEGVVNCSSDIGTWVRMYHVRALNREVKSWYQPLLGAAGRGTVILLMRTIGGQSQVLIGMDSEFGISSGRSLLPTFITYPGENENPGLNSINGKIKAEFLQSDEGGRFYKHESLYRLMEVDADFEAGGNRQWIAVHDLKKILQTSNLVSFQLRCISSLLLNAMNPVTFSGQ